MKRTISIAIFLMLACSMAFAQNAIVSDPTVALYKGDYNGGSNTPATKFVSRLNAYKILGPKKPISNALSEFNLKIDDATQTATYSFSMSNVKGYIMSHIHLGNATTEGIPVVALLPGLKTTDSKNITGGAGLPTVAPLDICTLVYTDTFSATDLITFANTVTTWTSFVAQLRAGNTYVNIHTSTYPAGVIRGQLDATTKKDFNIGCRN